MRTFKDYLNNKINKKAIKDGYPTYYFKNKYIEMLKQYNIDFTSKFFDNYLIKTNIPEECLENLYNEYYLKDKKLNDFSYIRYFTNENIKYIKSGLNEEEFANIYKLIELEQEIGQELFNKFDINLYLKKINKDTYYDFKEELKIFIKLYGKEVIDEKQITPEIISKCTNESIMKKIPIDVLINYYQDMGLITNELFTNDIRFVNNNFLSEMIIDELSNNNNCDVKTIIKAIKELKEAKIILPVFATPFFKFIIKNPSKINELMVLLEEVLKVTKERFKDSIDANNIEISITPDIIITELKDNPNLLEGEVKQQIIKEILNDYDEPLNAITHYNLNKLYEVTATMTKEELEKFKPIFEVLNNPTPDNIINILINNRDLVTEFNISILRDHIIPVFNNNIFSSNNAPEFTKTEEDGLTIYTINDYPYNLVVSGVTNKSSIGEKYTKTNLTDHPELFTDSEFKGNNLMSLTINCEQNSPSYIDQDGYVTVGYYDFEYGDLISAHKNDASTMMTERENKIETYINQGGLSYLPELIDKNFYDFNTSNSFHYPELRLNRFRINNQGELIKRPPMYMAEKGMQIHEETKKWARYYGIPIVRINNEAIAIKVTNEMNKLFSQIENNEIPFNIELFNQLSYLLNIYNCHDGRNKIDIIKRIASCLSKCNDINDFNYIKEKFSDKFLYSYLTDIINSINPPTENIIIHK